MSAFQLYRISWFPKNLSSRALNVFKVGDETMLSGKLFHSGIILLEKNKFTYIVMNMRLLQCISMMSCIILSLCAFSCYPFSYLTVIF